MQARVVVSSQAALFVIENMREVRQLCTNRQNLVDLLLVLHQRDLHVGVFEDVGHLLGDSVGIDRHRHGPQPLRGTDAPIERGAVGADDRHFVADANAERA